MYAWRARGRRRGSVAARAGGSPETAPPGAPAEGAAADLTGGDPLLVREPADRGRDGEAHWIGQAPAGAPTGGNPVEALRDTMALLHTERFEDVPPLTSGLVGFVGWEAVRRWEKLPHPPEDDLRIPELAMNLVSDIAIHDNTDGTVMLVANAINFDDTDERVDEAWVLAKYAVRADQYADFATLRGDTSDGLPGVKGVGDKTAASLLQKYDDLDGVRAAALDPSSDLGPGPRGKIKEAAAYLDVAPKVVAVARDIDLPRDHLALPRVPADPDQLAALVERWSLSSPVERLTGVLASRS